MPKLIEFPEQTVVIAKDQPEYLPMPAHRLPPEEDPTGRVTCCWEFSPEELLAIAANGGRVWQSILTFNDPLQPQMLSVEKPEGVQ